MNDHWEEGTCTGPGTYVLNEFISEIIKQTAFLTGKAQRGKGARYLEETGGAQYIKPEWGHEGH